MTPDGELLRRYAELGDEAAFAEVVRRQFGLVYGVACRAAGGDVHRAQEVAQLVFTDMARKARALAERPVLASWLHTSTRYAAAKLHRAEVRRWKHEQEAGAMKALLREGEEPAAQWERLRPVIDDAVQDLGERDREAVLQRFFAHRGFAEIGASLGVSEDAARMRVDRALGKLRDRLASRGLTSTGAALGALLTEQAMAAAPSVVVASVTSAALAGAGTSAAGTGLIGFMASTKLQLSAAAAIVVAGAVGVTWQSRAHAALREEIGALQRSSAELAAVRAEYGQLARQAAEVEALQRDDVELARLSEEIAAVRFRQGQAARAEADARAAREAELRAMPVFPEDQLEVKPKAHQTLVPRIPEAIRRDGLRVEAVFNVVIDADGGIRDIETVKSENAEWTEVALAVLKSRRYEPGQKDGHPVNARVQVPFIFTTQSRDEPRMPAKPGTVSWQWF